MRFWIVENECGEVVTAQTSRAKAVKEAAAYFDEGATYRMYWVEVAVNAEVVRRLLGDEGGYAQECSDGEWCTV